MRRLFGWMAGVVSIAALARLLSRRRHEEPQAPVPDPADELKAKLTAARQPDPVPPKPEPDATAAPAEEPPSLDERRARVHEQAQRAIDEMQEPKA